MSPVSSASCLARPGRSGQGRSLQMASSPLFQALRVAYNDDTPEGYWGEKTSTLNFCEEVRNSSSTVLGVADPCLPPSTQDYVVSYYCAEVCNVSYCHILLFQSALVFTDLTLKKTLTNLLFLWLGFKGVHNCTSQGHPRIFLVAYLGYVIVGLGSTAFHTSLKCSSSPLAQYILC